MGKILFIVGGARSGKSSHAVRLAEDFSEKVAYVATCVPYDDEMHERVALHKKERPSTWQTFEEPMDLAPVLRKIDSDVVIIDCLTLFTSNLLMADFDEEAVKDRTRQMLQALKEAKYRSILVANEVGLGIVPEYPLARKFRDVAGRVNQLVSREADDVLFAISGRLVKLEELDYKL